MNLERYDMKVISHKDPDLDPYRDEISEHVATYESMGLSYCLFVEETSPLAVYFTGHEPVNLLLPMGTPMSMIQVLDYSVSAEVHAEVVSEALRLGKKHGAKYVLSQDIPTEENSLLDVFKQKGFEVRRKWLRMKRSLKDIVEAQGVLKLETVEREDLRGFLEWLGYCMTGSEGEQEDITLANMLEVPDQLLDFWYTMQELYNVYRDDDLIGALNLTPGSDTNLNNVGVAPEKRGKGYGREITAKALSRLRTLGKENVGLRVYAGNEPAIGLYGSLGFKTETETADLIMWQNGPS
ncbi:MAG: GNAT family N-acetyltransferase [Promethearchaeota archaeon]